MFFFYENNICKQDAVVIFDCYAKQMFHTCIQYNRCYTHDKKLKNKALTVTYQIATQISSGWAQMDVMLQLVSQVPVPLQLDTSKSQNLHSWRSWNGLCKGCIPSRIKQKQDHPLNISTILPVIDRKMCKITFYDYWNPI